MEDALSVVSPHQSRRAPEPVQVRRIRRGADVRQVQKAAGDAMRSRNIVIGCVLAAVGATSLAAQQKPATAAKPATAKPAASRTVDGKADLQGIWTNATI